ncbi:MAG: integrase family protein [Candidatus Magnetoglobus multicellularis str. Araruama]|uniref:Integrase family protein n=1 Tax=Candidatus Magnetoglobus multicellularis str. Araruama TaxID=890399 RepID=A0A1V1NU66_9BACT|nr:MAG: integrase family protein [Candidatus Magnetoglobus multicellularis str. Araruama]
MKALFKHLRDELGVKVTRAPKKLPDVPTEEEIERYYKAVWKSQNFHNMVIIKTFLYTGMRVNELVNLKLTDVDYDRCQIRINKGKGEKDRVVPFPASFKEVLAMHADKMRKQNAEFLFESSWKKNTQIGEYERYLPSMSKMQKLKEIFRPIALGTSF